MRTTAPINITRNGYTYVRLPFGAGYNGLLIDQRIQFGAPCIRGTRIPAETIAGMHQSGESVNTLTKMYGLRREQVQACIDYVNVPVKAQL